MLSRNLFEIIPSELLFEIFFYLNSRDLYCICLINKEWAELITHENLIPKQSTWQKFFNYKSKQTYHTYRIALGYTSLHFAAENGNAKDINNLIKNGANIEAADSNGATPLAIAAYYGNKESVRILLENGAAINSNNYINAPFRLAIKRDHDEIVKLLLETSGTIIGLKKNETPQLVAAKYGAIKIIKFLFETLDDELHKHALFTAAAHGHSQVVKFLLKHGANINQGLSFDNDTALHLVALKGRTKAVSVLLDNGADINAKNSDGATPIFIAAANNQIDTVKILLKYGAEVKLARHDGETPYSIAIKNNYFAIINVLNAGKNNLNARFKQMIFGQQLKRNLYDDGIASNHIQDEENNNSRKISQNKK